MNPEVSRNLKNVVIEIFPCYSMACIFILKFCPDCLHKQIINKYKGLPLRHCRFEARKNGEQAMKPPYPPLKALRE
jgi:hypothetical protein